MVRAERLPVRNMLILRAGNKRSVFVIRQEDVFPVAQFEKLNTDMPGVLGQPFGMNNAGVAIDQGRFLVVR